MEDKSKLIEQLNLDADLYLRKMSNARQHFYERVIGKIETLAGKQPQHEGTRLKLRALQGEIMHQIADFKRYFNSKEVQDYINSIK